MRLVERHVIKTTHPHYLEIDRGCFASKNLYNYANYIIRQEFIHNKQYLNYNTIQKMVQDSEPYCALPRKVSQQILMVLHRNWVSFFEAIKVWTVNPGAFTGRPKLPNYKHKENGRNLLVYTIQSLSKPALRNGVIAPSGTTIKVQTQVAVDSIQQVRIVPKLDHYVVEVIYEQITTQANVDPCRILSIDLGVNNLAAVASNLAGFRPFLINGRPLKSINQYFNQRKAQLQTELPKGKFSSHQIRKVTRKRNFQIDNYLHKASRLLIDYAASNGFGTIVIGKNDGWKQSVNIGKRNNQNFVYIPHDRFIHQVQYKAALVGIAVIVDEESYTSKASFLDLDPIPVYQSGVKTSYQFSGRRVKRGLYRASNGYLINADINSSFNILRKVIPTALCNGISGFVVSPVKVTLAYR